MGISTPSPPLLNIEGLRDAPGSIYLSDGRTRICKCTYGIKISISSYKMKTKVEHRTSRAKKQGRPANRQWPPVARERVLQDMLESQSLLWVIFGHLSPCRSLQISALSPAPSCSLLCTPWKRRQNHRTAQGCPLSPPNSPRVPTQLTAPIPQQILCVLESSTVFPTRLHCTAYLHPFDLYNTTYFRKHFPNVKVPIPVPIHLQKPQVTEYHGGHHHHGVYS